MFDSAAFLQYVFYLFMWSDLYNMIAVYHKIILWSLKSIWLTFERWALIVYIETDKKKSIMKALFVKKSRKNGKWFWFPKEMNMKCAASLASIIFSKHA